MIQPPPPCTPGRRCHRHRTCPHCAAIRQAKVADQAEALLAGLDDVRLYTYKATGTSTRNIKSIHRTAKTDFQQARGIWTIEQSAHGPALHLHVLGENLTLHPRPGLEIYKSDPIRNIRHAAAYLVKPRSAPETTIYPGRTYGTWGQVTRHLLDPSTPPLPHALALEKTLADRAPVIPDMQTENMLRRWLPKLHHIAKLFDPQKRPFEQEKKTGK